MKTDKLFELIKSLTKSEKGYFKKNASFHTIGGKNNYADLFDAIENQKQYDEKRIITQFSDRKFAKRLPVAKAYLYESIINSLREYSRSSKNWQLLNYIEQVKILYERGLPSHCRKIIIKAKQIAGKQEHLHLPLLLELIQWEQRLMTKSLVINSTEAERKNIVSEMETVVKFFSNNTSYWYLSNKISSFYNSLGELRNKKEMNQLETLLKHPLLQNESSALSLYARKIYYEIKAKYSLIKKDRHGQYNYCKKLLELQGLSISDIKNDPALVINLLFASVKAGKIDKEFRQYLELLKRIIDEHAKNMARENITVSIYASYCVIKMEMLLTFYGEYWGEVDPVVKETTMVLKRYENKMNAGLFMLIYFKMAYIYFIAGQYDKSLKSINKLLGAPKNHYRSDLLSAAYVLNIIIHYELKHFDVLEYFIRSAYRFLLKQERLFRFEKIVLKFIQKRIPVEIEKKKLIQRFRELKNELVEIAKDPFENNFLDNFDYISWLESKIENRAFADILKERSKQLKLSG